MESSRFDVAVVGGGIAGASAAAEIAAHARVVLLEAEEQPGYHATGRSAAYFAPAYGNRVVRRVTEACEGFYREPPPGFTEVALLHPREVVFLARADQSASLERAAQELGAAVQRLDAAALREAVPILRPDYAAAGLRDDRGGDLDVDAILQGYLRTLRRRDGEVLTRARVEAVTREPAGWRVITPAGEVTAPVVVNAAGAWADAVAALAGLEPLGLEPTRRTALLVDPPDGADVSRWPMVVDVDEQFYFKPDAGAILVSPADATTSPPCDAQPEELDVAVAVDRFERATTVEVRRVRSRWAGLRTFARDMTPVVGFDPRASGFFWLAGQGGYGVQSAPALAQLTRHLVTGEALAPGFESVLEAMRDLSPGRLLA